MSLTNQARELAQVIASEAQALAEGVIPEGLVYAQLSKLADNVTMLRAWVPDDREMAWPNRHTAPVADPFAGIDENTEYDATRPAVS